MRPRIRPWGRRRAETDREHRWTAGRRHGGRRQTLVAPGRGGAERCVARRHHQGPLGRAAQPSGRGARHPPCGSRTCSGPACIPRSCSVSGGRRSAAATWTARLGDPWPTYSGWSTGLGPTLLRLTGRTGRLEATKGTRMRDRTARQTGSPVEHRDVAEMRSILELARRAPSVHNTQPWRWRIDGRVLELRADRSRQLRVADPLGRNLMISCGCALHHAVVGAGALGWRASVDLLPERAEPDVLARLHLVPVEVPDDSRERAPQHRGETNRPSSVHQLAGPTRAPRRTRCGRQSMGRTGGRVDRPHAAMAGRRSCRAGDRLAGAGRPLRRRTTGLDGPGSDRRHPERGPDRGSRSHRRASDAFHAAVDADDRPHDRGVRWADHDRDEVGRTAGLAARGAGTQCALAGCRGRRSVGGAAQPGDRAQRDPARRALRRDVREHGAADPGPPGVAGDRPCELRRTPRRPLDDIVDA